MMERDQSTTGAAGSGAGAGAAHNANLPDAYTAAVTSSVAADADLRGARRAQTTAQAKVDALRLQLLREHSEAQARELVLAEQVLERAHADVAECKADAERSRARLARVESELDASRAPTQVACAVVATVTPLTSVPQNEAHDARTLRQVWQQLREQLDDDGYLPDTCTLYELKAGNVWILPSGRRVLIRHHYPRLLELLCNDMKLALVGKATPRNVNRGLLVGTPGTGKTTFMWLVAIQLMKMVLTRSDQAPTAAFNPRVNSIEFRWTGMMDGRPLYVSHDGDIPDSLTCVHLYDAGMNLMALPAQKAVFAIGASSSDARHYEKWITKDSAHPRYSRPWEWPEMQWLSEQLQEGSSDTTFWKLDNLAAKFKIIGGNPRAVFDHKLQQLHEFVQDKLEALSAENCALLNQAVKSNTSPAAAGVSAFSLLQLAPVDEEQQRAHVKFATPYLLHAFAETKDSGGLEKIGEILHRALSTNSVGVEDLFEGYTCTLLALHGIPGRDVLFMDNNSKLGRLIRRAVARAAPAVVRYFVSKEDLETLANELGYGKGFFIPMSRVQGVIDAFGWVYIDDELRLVGFQVTRSPTHPISGSQLVQVNELARIIKSAPIKPAHLGARAPGREDATTEAAVPPAAPGGEKLDVLMFTVPAQLVPSFGLQRVELTGPAPIAGVCTDAGVGAGAGSGGGAAVGAGARAAAAAFADHDADGDYRMLPTSADVSFLPASGSGGHVGNMSPAGGKHDGDGVPAAGSTAADARVGPWKYEQAKFGILVHVGADGMVVCPNSLASYSHLVKSMATHGRGCVDLGGDSSIEQMGTAAAIAFRGKVAKPGRNDQGTRQAIVNAFHGASTLDEAIAKLSSSSLYEEAIALLKGAPKQWCFKKFQLDPFVGFKEPGKDPTKDLGELAYREQPQYMSGNKHRLPSDGSVANLALPYTSTPKKARTASAEGGDGESG